MKTVILIGDSIRMGYEDVVRRQLAGRYEVWAPTENGATSANVLAHLDEWAIERAADLVHVNCGLHDLRKDFGQETSAIPLAAYTANVRTILSRLQSETNALVVWAAITPVNGAWHHATKGFDRFEADVDAYNTAATAVAGELGVVIDDLFTVAQQAGPNTILQPDGVHFTADGYELLGTRVAEFVSDALAGPAGAE